MVNKERLYQTFGELLYVVAMSDGVIQEEEVETLENIVKAHPQGKDIEWSFNYERANQSDIEMLYKKVIQVLTDHGPDEEYDIMIYALKEIAEASQGIDSNEKKVIDNFSNDLLQRFIKDIEKIKERYT